MRRNRLKKTENLFYKCILKSLYLNAHSQRLDYTHEIIIRELKRLKVHVGRGGMGQQGDRDGAIEETG
jgi:hypothetical protein